MPKTLAVRCGRITQMARREISLKTPKQFNPTTHSPLPFVVDRGNVWHRVVAANGKVVCSCRNIKDAEMIVKAVNSTDR